VFNLAPVSAGPHGWLPGFLTRGRRGVRVALIAAAALIVIDDRGPRAVQSAEAALVSVESCPPQSAGWQV
jgi:hypothetical protein